MNKITSKIVYSKINCINLILESVDSDRFRNNEKAIKKLCKILDDFYRKMVNNDIFNIIAMKEGKNEKIIVLNSYTYNLRSRSVMVSIYSKNLSISHPMTIEIHDKGAITDICNKTIITRNIDAMITETLTGYKLNVDKNKELEDLINTSKSMPESLDDLDPEIKNIITEIDKSLEKKENQYKNIKDRVKKLFKSKKISDSVKDATDYDLFYPIIRLDIIRKVIDLFNIRYYLTEEVDYNTSYKTISRHTLSSQYEHTGNIGYDKVGKIYKSKGTSFIPYDMIDEGRILFDSKYISENPREDKNYINNFVDFLINDTSITLATPRFKTVNFSSIDDKINLRTSYDNPKEILTNAKDFVNRYMYMYKKLSSINEDIKISDNIMYNKNGKLTCNDFSLEVNDEYIKNNIQEYLKDNIVAYYEQKVTDQEILDRTLDLFYRSLQRKITSNFKDSDEEINIIFNDKVKVKVERKINECYKEGKLVRRGLLYINDQRFNTNEVVDIIKEISCYTNEKEAYTFIKNVGRLGLSVYIGITSGYNLHRYGKDILMKFRKNKGAGNYTLLLNDYKLRIKGKEIMNVLYDPPSNLYGKISNCIEQSPEGLFGLIKYESLIEYAYHEFKKKAESYLNKKIEELGGKKDKYLTNSEILDCIHIEGKSGNEYVIAYNNTDSYVFKDAKFEDGKYKEGKYICMVDQSNIKSNIGYDTVVSKMFALKNDSVISHKIYNLEEEI